MSVVAGAHATLANGRPAMALPVPVFHRRDHASFAWRTGCLGHAATLRFLSTASSEGVTPLSSLLRAHVPLSLGSPLLQHLTSFEESLQVVRSPRCPRELPELFSENLSLDAGSPTPARSGDLVQLVSDDPVRFFTPAVCSVS